MDVTNDEEPDLNTNKVLMTDQRILTPHYSEHISSLEMKDLANANERTLRI